jgi:tetratricopeptide (TPR) repeat protein
MVDVSTCLVSLQESSTMHRRLRDTLVTTSALTLLALPALVAPQPVQAQDGSRFRVMVPKMQPTDGTRERFGERVAERVRDRIDLDTHVGMSGRDMDRAAREYDMRGNDLDCLGARQLASLVEVQLVMCGEYAQAGDQLQVSARFYTVPGGEEYTIEPFMARENDENGATAMILERFEALVERVQVVGYCGTAYASSDWNRALEQCTRAVALAPESPSAKIALAGTHMELGNFEESLALFQQVLAVDEYNSDVLLNAGYASAQLGETEQARGYYTRYLDINPGSASVRQSVAYDLAQSGDVEGAMAFVAAGLEENPDDVGLLEAYGSYAFRTALERQGMAPVSQDGEMDPEIAALFREASETLMQVVELEGAESNPSYVVNAIRAYLQLNEPDVALRTAERGLEIFPEAANIWLEKGTVHNRLEQVDQAVASLERAMEIDPNVPNIRARMGNYLVQAGRLDDGLPYLKQAIEAGEQTADQVANTIFADAHSNGIRDNQNLAYGIERIQLAKNELAVSTEFRQQLDFWHGYALFQQAIRAQEPSNVQSARATRPQFVRAKELLQAGQPYVQRTNVIGNFNEFIGNVDTYIEIQDAIIRRGG